MKGFTTYAKFGRSVLLVCGMAAVVVGTSAPARAQTRPDPGNLTSFRSQIGQSFDFEVTGSTTGRIWGTDVYTDDSHLATATVHAGVLANGQKGVVRVTILPGQASYTSTTRNGVTSTSYGSWSGSYRVSAITNAPNPPAPAAGSFHGVWSTNLGLYFGLVQSTDQQGRQVVRGYAWLSDYEGNYNWYPILTGIVTGDVLTGEWDAWWAYGTFRFTMAPDRRGFDAYATGLYGLVEIYFAGGLFAYWQ